MTKSPEIIILAVALSLLALAAAGLAYTFPAATDITGVTSLEAKGQPVKKITAEDFATTLAPWNSPAVWQEPESHSRLFDSDRWLFYPSAYYVDGQAQGPTADDVKRVDEKTRSPSGVLLSWYEKYKLDFGDPNIDREDPDNDGFSNIVEYKNESVGARLKAADCDGSKSSNPLDPQSHPSYLSRLRLQQFESRPFRIQFKGIEQLSGVNFFQIYLSDVPSDQQPPLKKTGDPLGVEGYIVGPYVHKIVTKVDPATGISEEVDVSTIELDKPDIGFSIKVPFREVIDSPESTADFVMLMPNDRDKVMKVPRGKTFTISYLPDTIFLVLSADDNGATIRDIKTKQEYHILKLDPGEWDEVPEPVQESQPKSP